jgi:hypothetical protein
MDGGVGARVGCHLSMASTVGQFGVELYTVGPRGQYNKVSSNPVHAKDDGVCANPGGNELGIKLLVNCSDL